MDKAGQIFSLDLLLAMSIFIVILGVIIIAAYTMSGAYTPYSLPNSEANEIYLTNNVNEAINLLAQSYGNPTDWQMVSCSKILSLGLLNSSTGLLSMQKLYNLTTLPVGCLSNLIRGGDYFNITAYYLNYTPLEINGRYISVGFPPPKSSSVVSVSRFLVENGGQIVRLTLSEWI